MSDLLTPPSSDLASWLAELDAELLAQTEQLGEEEAQAEAVWSHMSNALHRFRAHEIDDIVNAKLEVARRRGGIDALREMVRMEREHLGHRPPATNGVAADSATLRRLRESLTRDRSLTGRSMTGEVLETLCSIALDLELTERRVGHDPATIAQALADLRGHITTAASTVRALPDHVQVRSEAGEALAFAVRRCIVRYAGTLEVELTWSGGEASSSESASALLWVLQEILHHLHQVVAGWAKVSVRVDDHGIAMRVETPTTALAVDGPEPDWLLRSTLRLSLAGGYVSSSTAGKSSYADVALP
jgi:hypothetical protein